MLLVLLNVAALIIGIEPDSLKFLEIFDVEHGHASYQGAIAINRNSAPLLTHYACLSASALYINYVHDVIATQMSSSVRSTYLIVDLLLSHRAGALTHLLLHILDILLICLLQLLLLLAVLRQA